jgi:excinuclease ABC subunit A
MLKSSGRSAIRLRGVRHNNLKNFDLDLPLNQLIVVTGSSGSGKSSLAFDTLFAEGQRRYIETFSPYARQFFDRMDKPQVDSIEGIPPAIAIEQRNAVKTTRSTVGTMTEICDYMKVVWPHLAQLHCRKCGQPVRKDSPQQIWQALQARPAGTRTTGDEAPDGTEVLITFELPLAEKLSLEESLSLVARQGYQRLLLDDQVIRLDEFISRSAQKRNRPSRLTVIQDRLRCINANRSRFVEACEQAYHFGKGKLALYERPEAGVAKHPARRFSNWLHCAQCDLEYREPSPALFSFNHPVGACPICRGFGRVISIDYDLVLPDRTKTLEQGVVKPWQSGQSAECQDDLLRTCPQHGVPTDVPFNKLPQKWQDLVIQGDPDYGKDRAHEWPRAWYGVKGYFRWLESRAYKMHVRVLLSRYRSYTPCPVCQGKRFQPETLLYRVDSKPIGNGAQSVQFESAGILAVALGQAGALSLTLADFYQLPVRDALQFIECFARRPGRPRNDPLQLALNEVQSRLAYLSDVGLGYLTLDRPTRSLSGGETERVNLTTCLGSRLVNTLFVLDEPSVGLHSRDTDRLVKILEQLRDAGNTVLVVEHEASVIRAADQIIDLGPGHGASGGHVVFQGPYQDILKSPNSLTGDYLSGRRRMDQPRKREPSRPQENHSAISSTPANSHAAPDGERRKASVLRLAHATLHNLKDVTVEIPLNCLVCVTGVSGSGKTTLIREVLLPTLISQLNTQRAESEDPETLPSETESEESGEDRPFTHHAGHSVVISGSEPLAQVVLVDQSILGKTPRSNPAVYIGAFDEIRELFAQSEQAKQRGLTASAFSFNSSQGQCERCRGCGFEKIEMQFLSDVFIRCPECDGRRYRPHILEIRISPDAENPNQEPTSTNPEPPKLSIGDLLEATVEEAIEFLAAFSGSRAAQRAVQNLRWLAEVGLGYLKLGQPINTLSGGESQRLKLVKHLAEATKTAATGLSSTTPDPKRERTVTKRTSTLFLFDEPTTGLHFDDIRVLLNVFQKLVDAGHSLLVIEHNLEVIQAADWVIDLGPDAGDQGGRVVAVGTADQIAACPESHTGKALRQVASITNGSNRLFSKNRRIHR